MEAKRFLRELRQLRSEACLELAELAARAHYPTDVIVAAEIGPDLPELPVLSAYVRGCGAGLAEWEERWRSVTGSPATSLCLPARPAGSSSLAEAGAQAAYSTPAVDPEDKRRILAAITKAAAASATIPGQPSAAGMASVPGEQGDAPDQVPEELAAVSAAAPAGSTAEPGVAVPAPGAPAQAAPPSPAPAVIRPATRIPRRGVAARRAALPYGAGIAALVAAIMCIVGAILLLLR